MTMIVPVSGKTGTEILQTLNSELPEGTTATLADLVQIAGVASARELPKFWAIDNGVITGASDIEADLIPASWEARGVSPHAATAAIPPAPGEGTQATPYTIPLDLLEGDQKIVAEGGLTAAPASDPVVLGVKRGAPASPSAFVTQKATTTTTTSQEQDLKKMVKLHEQELGIATEISDFNVGQAKTEATAELMRVRREAVLEDVFAEKREERQKRQTARENELVTQVEAATLEYKNAEIDSERIWKKKGTGSRILAAIAAGLGAYASAMTGTKNFALEIINKAISDDIEAQKAEIAIKGGVITEQRNLLNDLRNKGMSDTEAENAAHVIMLSRSETMLQQKLAKSKVESVKQEGELLLKQLRIQSELALETLRLGAEPKVVIAVTEKQVVSQASKLLTARELAKQQSLGREEGKSLAKQTVELSDAEKRALSVDGYLGLAPTVEEAKKARDASKKLIEGIQALDNLVAKRLEHGFKTDWFDLIPDADREAAKTDAILFLGMIKNQLFLDLGVLQEADVTLLAKAVPQDPLGVFREGPTLAQYQTIRDYMVKSGEIYFDTLGLIPEGGVRVDLKKEGLRKQLQAAFSAYKP